MAPIYPLVTARLTLTPLVAQDLDDLLAYRSRADVCRYLPFDPQTRTGLASRLAGDMALPPVFEEGTAITLGVRVRGSAHVIGDVILMYRSRLHLGAEVGYVFTPEVARLGYAAEACAAVLALGFDGYGLHRVVARLDARNDRSARLAARLGMRLEAHLMRNEMFKGEWADELVYAMLAEDWPDSPAGRVVRKPLSSA